MPHFPKPFFKKSRQLWYVEIDRRQIRLGPDRDEAFRRYHQLMTERREIDTAPESLVAIVDAFLDWTKKNRAPDTFEWYRYRLQRFVERYPDSRVADLRPHHVDQWVNDYELSRTSRRNYLRSVKRCLSWAEKQGYLDSNPIASLEVPSADHREIAISQDEFDRLISYSRDKSFTELLEVTWETGCRPQELLRLEPRHVDLEKRRWVFPRSESKMKRLSRIVYMTDKVFAITKNRLGVNHDGPVFRNSKGRPWNSEAVNCGFDRIRHRMGSDEMNRLGETISSEDIDAFIPSLKDTKVVKGVTVKKTAAELRTEAKTKLKNRRATALVPRYSLYALRHSWATNALKSGVDPLTVAILMGHEDPSTLARVYQHLSLSPDHLLEQAKRAAG